MTKNHIFHNKTKDKDDKPTERRKKRKFSTSKRKSMEIFNKSPQRIETYPDSSKDEIHRKQELSLQSNKKSIKKGSRISPRFRQLSTQEENNEECQAITLNSLKGTNMMAQLGVPFYFQSDFTIQSNINLKTNEIIINKLIFFYNFII